MNVKDITSLSTFIIFGVEAEKLITTTASTLIDLISNRVSFIVMSFHVHNICTDPLKDITVTMEI